MDFFFLFLVEKRCFFFYQEPGRCRGNKLNETDNDGGIATIKRCSSWFEDADSVENHGVNAGELLEEHDAHGNAERFQNGSFQQFSRLDLLLLAVLCLVFFHTLKFSFNVCSPDGFNKINQKVSELIYSIQIEQSNKEFKYILSAQAPKSFFCVIFSIVWNEPNGSLGHEDHSSKQNHRKYAQNKRQNPPVDKGTDDVSHQNTQSQCAGCKWTECASNTWRGAFANL